MERRDFGDAGGDVEAGIHRWFMRAGVDRKSYAGEGSDRVIVASMRFSHLSSIVLVSLASIAFAASAPPSEGPYKCRGDSATPIYQDSPCASGRELRNFAEQPANVSVIPFATAPAPAPAPLRPPKTARAPPKDKDKPRVVADARERRHVYEGMSEAEVLARLGPPDMQAGKTGRRMRWTYLPAAGDAQTVTLLGFEEGKVKDIERRILR